MQAEEEDPAYEDVTFSKNANLGRWAVQIFAKDEDLRRANGLHAASAARILRLLRSALQPAQPTRRDLLLPTSRERAPGRSSQPVPTLAGGLLRWPARRWTNFVNLQDMCGVSVFSGLLRLQANGGGGGGATAEQRRRAEHLAATGNASPGGQAEGGPRGGAPRGPDATLCRLLRRRMLPGA